MAGSEKVRLVMRRQK